MKALMEVDYVFSIRKTLELKKAKSFQENQRLYWLRTTVEKGRSVKKWGLVHLSRLGLEVICIEEMMVETTSSLRKKINSMRLLHVRERSIQIYSSE